MAGIAKIAGQAINIARTAISIAGIAKIAV
jgi:hypothetical protein